MEVCGQLLAPAFLPPRGKSPWYPLDRRLDGPQSWSGHGKFCSIRIPVKYAYKFVRSHIIRLGMVTIPQ
jgi:hypothetical protein